MQNRQSAHSDEELVAGCVRNDRWSQELLYRRYFNSMMRMCMRYTRNREQSLEIVNSGFLRVFKKLDTFEFKGSLEGWIRKLVYHSLCDYFNKKENKPVHFLVFEDRDTPIPQEALKNLYAEDILKMVDELPPATRNVFVLYAIEGYTHVEIAQKLDISDGTSKWHLSNARKKLREMIQQTYAGNNQKIGS
jgi:RNA polymerase sigma factor (sigma-70 family)